MPTGTVGRLVPSGDLDDRSRSRGTVGRLVPSGDLDDRSRSRGTEEEHGSNKNRQGEFHDG